METDQSRCASCGAPLIRGAAFCESCGAPVQEEASSAVSEPQVSPAPCSPPVERQVAPPAVSQKQAASYPFVLSVALPAAMQVGRRSLVSVRFRALSDIYESVVFELRRGDEVLSRRQCCPGRPFAIEHRVSLDVTPSACGSAVLGLYVICRITADGEEETHLARLRVDVDDKAATSFSPVFNISQTQTSDRAGDTNGGNINVNLGGLNLKDEQDASRYATSAAFSPCDVHLYKSPARLTLKNGASVVQLLSDREISFGRNSDNTIPLRVFGDDGTLDSRRNENNISRFHFRLMRTAGDCMIADGGAAANGEGPRPSAYGTRVDGCPVQRSGSLRLPPNREVALGVGREPVELKMRLEFFRDDWGRPSGVLVDRQDGADLRVCAVWREVALNGSEKVLWDGNRWSLSSARSSLVQLPVGTSVSIGGKSFDVLPFIKTHLN